MYYTINKNFSQGKGKVFGQVIYQKGKYLARDNSWWVMHHPCLFCISGHLHDKYKSLHVKSI